MQMTQYRYWCRFYHIRCWGNKKWWDYYVELARDLESDCDVTIPVTCRIPSNTDATYSILYDVDSTVFDVGELKYKEGNDVPLARDLAKDWRHDFCDPVLSISRISILCHLY